MDLSKGGREGGKGKEIVKYTDNEWKEREGGREKGEARKQTSLLRGNERLVIDLNGRSNREQQGTGM